MLACHNGTFGTECAMGACGSVWEAPFLIHCEERGCARALWVWTPMAQNGDERWRETVVRTPAG